MTLPPNTIYIGRIVRLFGKKGELLVRLYEHFCKETDGEEPLFVTIDGLEVPLFLSSFILKGNEKAVVSFDDIDNEYRAGELVGKELYIYTPNENNEEDELYFEDLIGYHFIDSSKKYSGTIISYEEHGDNPLFIVNINDIEVMIPAVEELINSIDTEKQIIEMHLPEGLIELYLFPDISPE